MTDMLERVAQEMAGMRPVPAPAKPRPVPCAVGAHLGPVTHVPELDGFAYHARWGVCAACRSTVPMEGGNPDAC
jgi:hypothetical protein